jgi:hypothetical protein
MQSSGLYNLWPYPFRTGKTRSLALLLSGIVFTFTVLKYKASSFSGVSYFLITPASNSSLVFGSKVNSFVFGASNFIEE